MMSARYEFSQIEPKWQALWDERRCFCAVNPGEPGSERPKYYVLDFFPYPSGAGLHVGHPLGYIASDIVARFMRMRGYNVLHPMGWDAFGLPAEQYAIETGIHPAVTTRKNIETYKRQLRMIGLSYDWSREIATCDVDYYRWTQWIFLQIFNSWYDPEWHWIDRAGREVVGAARPIDRLPIPEEVKAQGELAVDEYKSQHRLAYLAEVPVNWCPALGTVLANEEVTADGRSERGNHPVYRRPMKQWMLRITEYADRLLADLEHLDWPEPIKLMQRNWIGRSEGAYVDFQLAGDLTNTIRVFTTRPDTLFGATYMVLAPEHRLVGVITTSERRMEVESYVEQARARSEKDRTAETKVKTGVFTGAYALNPVTRRPIPIWVADYVLIGYGTGSIMAVPGHDKRDLEFARKFGLDVIQVVAPPAGVDWHGFEGDGISCNSPARLEFEHQCDINGLPTPEAKRAIIHWLEERDMGEGTVQYKLRDWLFSRQRYWGEPFPIVYREGDGKIIGLSEACLPVELPPMDDFKPHASDDPNAEPQTPLSRAAQWRQVEIDGQRCHRELNTMPQWAGSCWYYLRFCDPHNSAALIDPKTEQYWAGRGEKRTEARFGFVDLYMGGAEHAVLHLLYARFWHKLLYDLGHVSTPEPFQKLFNQGMIGAASYQDERGVYVPASEVVEGPETEMERPDDHARVRTRFSHNGRPVIQAFEKMSKSLKNVVNPDDILREFGADTLRLYEMYMGPLEKSKPWNTNDIIGPHRFLQRVWRLVVEESAPSVNGTNAGEDWRISARIGDRPHDLLERLLHKTIRKVTEDISRFAFNTAIAQMMVWSNEAQKADTIGRDQIARFLIILSPFAPHLCEELWQRLGHADPLATAAWPGWDEAMTRDDTVEVAVQVLGKIKARIDVPLDAPDEDVITVARQNAAVTAALAGKPVKKAIVVKNRLVNLIV